MSGGEGRGAGRWYAHAPTTWPSSPQAHAPTTWPSGPQASRGRASARPAVSRSGGPASGRCAVASAGSVCWPGRPPPRAPGCSRCCWATGLVHCWAQVRHPAGFRARGFYWGRGGDGGGIGFCLLLASHAVLVLPLYRFLLRIPPGPLPPCYQSALESPSHLCLPAGMPAWPPARPQPTNMSPALPLAWEPASSARH